MYLELLRGITFAHLAWRCSIWTVRVSSCCCNSSLFRWSFLTWFVCWSTWKKSNERQCSTSF